MATRYVCPQCGERYSALDERRARFAQCPTCRVPVQRALPLLGRLPRWAALVIVLVLPVGGSAWLIAQAVRRGPESPKWSNAADGPVTLGDVSVTVTRAEVGRVVHKFLDPAVGIAHEEKCLQIHVDIANIGAADIRYTGWGSRQGEARLTNDGGNRYARLVFAPGSEIQGQVNQVGAVAISPHLKVSDIVVFEPPASDVSYLFLELPASCVGGSGAYRFRIPETYWKKASGAR